MRKMEDKLLLRYQEMTTSEMRESLALKKERLKIAKANYEFEYSTMLIEEIKEIQCELQRRKKVS
ncbi:hypothetical protein [Alkalihalobacillus sp. BA299]|uniref:hypothetical protein n=1 Tax=Alkalihalobacillus sp. BA299 TaxID=2815938 RepID=UPI001ADA3223|nr:hypothetical protein [Alkalihalobacillus sp. BA299]